MACSASARQLFGKSPLAQALVAPFLQESLPDFRLVRLLPGGRDDPLQAWHPLGDQC